MDNLIQLLRIWCGTVNNSCLNMLKSNRGEVRVFFTLGGLITALFVGLLFFQSCADCVTCGMFSKCAGCFTCGICNSTY